jgi:hypothetical protein
MNHLTIYNALCSEFGPVIALSVVQINTIDLTLKYKAKDYKQESKRTERILKKAKKLLWELSQEDYDLAVSLWLVTYEWVISQSLDGLGGCEKKTFLELLGKKRLKSA